MTDQDNEIRTTDMPERFQVSAFVRLDTRSRKNFSKSLSLEIM